MYEESGKTPGIRPLKQKEMTYVERNTKADKKKTMKQVRLDNRGIRENLMVHALAL